MRRSVIELHFPLASAPGWNRTSDLLFFRQTLLPTELPRHFATPSNPYRNGRGKDQFYLTLYPCLESNQNLLYIRQVHYLRAARVKRETTGTKESRVLPNHPTTHLNTGRQLRAWESHPVT